LSRKSKDPPRKDNLQGVKEYIEKNSDEVYYVPPCYKIFNDYYVIGIPPIALGAKDNALFFTYTKPWHGTFVLNIDDEEIKKEISDIFRSDNSQTVRFFKL
jgi:hypothetical protein